MDFPEFVSAVFNSWATLAGLIFTLLPFIENIPPIRRHVRGKQFIEKWRWLLWVIAAGCLFYGFYSAWETEHRLRLTAENKFKSPEFVLDIREVLVSTWQGNPLVVATSLLTNRAGAESGTRNWSMRLELDDGKTLTGIIPILFKTDVTANSTDGSISVILKRPDFMVYRTEQAVTPGSSVEGWFWATFPSLDDAYAHHAIVVVAFEDVVTEQKHEGRVPLPAK